MTSIGYPLDCQAASKEFASFRRIQTEMPRKGSSRLYVGPDAPPPGTYWLGSDTPMYGGPGEAGFFPDGEIVTVLRRRNGYIYLDRPFDRTWRGGGVLVLGAPILPEVALDGGKGPIHVGLADRVTIRNWSVESYNEARGISIQGCRNVQIERCRIDQVGGTGQSGTDYGIQIQRCSGVSIVSCRGLSNRHLVTLFASAGVHVSGCAGAMGTGTQFDLHFACEDCIFEGCDSGGSNFSVGNKWERGCSATARRLTNTAMAWVHGPSSLELHDMALSGPLGLQRNDFGSPVQVLLRNVLLGKYAATGHIHLEGLGPFNTRIVMEKFSPTAAAT